MTKQEIFNIVKTGLLQQNCKSMNVLGSCAYLGEHNRHCAIGFLIPPEHWVMKSMWNLLMIRDEDPDLWSVIAPSDLRNSLSDGQSYNFLKQLQVIHDMKAVWHWPEELHNFAVRWQVEPTQGDAS